MKLSKYIFLAIGGILIFNSEAMAQITIGNNLGESGPNGPGLLSGSATFEEFINGGYEAVEGTGDEEGDIGDELYPAPFSVTPRRNKNATKIVQRSADKKAYFSGKEYIDLEDSAFDPSLRKFLLDLKEGEETPVGTEQEVILKYKGSEETGLDFSLTWPVGAAGVGEQPASGERPTTDYHEYEDVVTGEEFLGEDLPDGRTRLVSKRNDRVYTFNTKDFDDSLKHPLDPSNTSLFKTKIVTAEKPDAAPQISPLKKGEMLLKHDPRNPTVYKNAATGEEFDAKEQRGRITITSRKDGSTRVLDPKELADPTKNKTDPMDEKFTVIKPLGNSKDLMMDSSKPLESHTGDATFDNAYNKLAEAFKKMRIIVYILGCFSLAAFGVAAFFGKLNWAWLAMIMISLFILAATDTIVLYATTAGEGNPRQMTANQVSDQFNKGNPAGHLKLRDDSADFNYIKEKLKSGKGAK